MKEYNA